MQPTLNNILHFASPLVIAYEATLESTNFVGDDFADQVSGDFAITHIDEQNIAESNAVVTLTNGDAKGSGSSEVISGSINRRRVLGDNFRSGAVTDTISIDVNYRASKDELHLRDWNNRPGVIKVGGVFRGQELLYSDFVNYMRGESLGRDFNEQSMGVAFSTESKIMQSLFPFNTYTSGALKGEAIPFIIGTVRNTKPKDLGAGLYQCHDGALYPLNEVTTVYDNGNTLTYGGSSDPLSDTPPSGQFYYSKEGFIRINPSDNPLITCDVEGMDFDASLFGGVGRVFYNTSGNCIWQLINAATASQVSVDMQGFGDSPYDYPDAGVGEEIGWVFDTQLPFSEHLSILLLSLDMYYVQSDVEEAVSVRFRYNGRPNNRLGNSNNRDSFYFDQDTIADATCHGTRTRPEKTNVLYNRNYHPLTSDGIPEQNRQHVSKEYYIESAINGVSSDSIRDIPSALIESSQALMLADQTASKDGSLNDAYTVELENIGHGLEVGDVGQFEYFMFKQNAYSEIIDINEESVTKTTQIEVITYG